MNLIDTNDPQVWAREFIRLIRANPGWEQDPALLIKESELTVWFQNAMIAHERRVREKIEAEYEDEIECAYEQGHYDERHGIIDGLRNG